jgi:Uri superfamily endonuclease
VPDVKGSYALVLRLDGEAEAVVGKLATHRFLPGYYLYLGSALGGIHSRVRRHVAGGRRLHWHIDYLRQLADVVEVWYMVSSQSLECRWYRAAAGMPEAQVAVAGFGSSGCRCASHLLYFASAPSFEEFRLRLGRGGAGLTRASPEAFG